MLYPEISTVGEWKTTWAFIRLMKLRLRLIRPIFLWDLDRSGDRPATPVQGGSTSPAVDPGSMALQSLKKQRSEAAVPQARPKCELPTKKRNRQTVARRSKERQEARTQQRFDRQVATLPPRAWSKPSYHPSRAVDYCAVVIGPCRPASAKERKAWNCEPIAGPDGNGQLHPDHSRDDESD
jgi:hypothetical protein